MADSKRERAPAHPFPPDEIAIIFELYDEELAREIVSRGYYTSEEFLAELEEIERRAEGTREA